MSRAGSPRARLVARLLVLGILGSLIALPAVEAPLREAKAASLTPNPETFDAVMDRQIRLTEIADAIAGVSEDERWRINGFGGIQMNPQAGTMRVYWKGTPPSSVKSAVGTASSDLLVEIVPVGHDRAEMQQARELLQRSAELVTPTYRITSIAIARDSSQLVLGIDVPNQADAEQVDAALMAAASQAHDLTGLDIATRQESLAGFASRQDDSSPWFGGAGMLTPSSAYCTTGFGVTRISDGKKMVLSAYHCGSSGTYRDRMSTIIGTVAGTLINRDAILINATGSGYRSYVGSRTSAASKPVVAANYNYNGQLVCTEGANFGEFCNVEIVNDDTSFVHPDNGVLTGPAIKAHQNTAGLSAIAAGRGDRGGAVVACENAGCTTINARGFISVGIGGQSSCPASMTGTQVCSDDIYYVAIRRTVSDLGVTVNVQP